MLKKLLYLIIRSEDRQKYITILVLSLLSFLLIFYLLIKDQFHSKNYLKPGDIAKEKIILTREIKYLNKKETEKIINQTKKNITPVYTLYNSINTEVIQTISDYFDFLDSIKKDNLSIAEVKYKIDKVFKYLILNNEDFNIVYKFYKINLFKKRIITIINSIFQKGYIKEIEHYNEKNKNIMIHFISDKEDKKYYRKIKDIITKDNLENYIENYISLNYPILNLKKRNILKNLIIKIIKPNLNYNETETKIKINTEVEKINPIFNIIKKGAVLVNKGEKITDEKYNILLKYEKDYKILNYKILISQIIFSFILFLLVSLYVINYVNNNNYSLKRIFLLFIYNLIFLLITMIIKNIDYIKNVDFIYKAILLPIPFVFISMSFIFNKKFTYYYLFFISFILTKILGTGFINFSIIFFSGYLSVFATKDVTKRENIFKKGGYIFIVQFLIILIDFLYNNYSVEIFIYTEFLSLLTIYLSIALSIGFLPFMEKQLNLSTQFRLYELADLNEGIFRELQIKAPGTYHHSMIVGNLAENAAKDINENYLLARVSSYYHDIGKLDTPEYFIENQRNNENKHKKIETSLSISIIKNHVKKGVQKAMELNLPEEIINIIKQHHGTSMIRYFYDSYMKKFAKSKKKPELTKEDFSYPGPKPKSKIAAIVMLADTIEAATKSIKENLLKKERLEEITNILVNQKIEEGQLSDSKLTFKELDIIKKSFVRILIGIFHNRIEYPSSNINNPDKKENNINQNILKINNKKKVKNGRK